MEDPRKLHSTENANQNEIVLEYLVPTWWIVSGDGTLAQTSTPTHSQLFYTVIEREFKNSVNNYQRC